MSRVVTTAGDHRSVRPHNVVVTHWWSASAIISVPSENLTRKHSRSVITGVAKVTRVGEPSPANTSWPGDSSPMVVQPLGVGIGVSSASALPDPSGPYISTTRPRGKPPMPSAMSSEIAPVGITSIGARTSSPSRITEPLPNWRSIWARAVSRALSLSPPLLPGLSMPAMDTPAGIRGFLSALTLRAATDKTPHAGQHHRDRAAAAVAGHHACHYPRRTTVRSGAGHAQFRKKPSARPAHPPTPAPRDAAPRP